MHSFFPKEKVNFTESRKLTLRVPHRGSPERRKRDLNPRAGFPTYTLSRGASSASWVFLLAWFKHLIWCCYVLFKNVLMIIKFCFWFVNYKIQIFYGAQTQYIPVFEESVRRPVSLSCPSAQDLLADFVKLRISGVTGFPQNILSVPLISGNDMHMKERSDIIPLAVKERAGTWEKEPKGS